MSSPTTAEQVLRNLVVDGVMPTPLELAELGLDIEMLKVRFDRIIPRLPRMLGYRPLSHFAPKGDVHEQKQFDDAGEFEGAHSVFHITPWSLSVVGVRSKYAASDYEVVVRGKSLKVDIFLTLQGGWIIIPTVGYPMFAETADDLLEAIKRIAPDGCAYQEVRQYRHHRAPRRVDSIPIYIIERLEAVSRQSDSLWAEGARIAALGTEEISRTLRRVKVPE